jgi:hypothetical protein
MKVVIDTNIFVSSFFGGNPKKIIDLWKKGVITLCLSKYILAEYLDVLERMGLERSLLMELLALFSKGQNILFAANPPTLSVVLDDPDDNIFIECAAALDATYIISGDKDLLRVGSYKDIIITTPLNFLDIL